MALKMTLPKVVSCLKSPRIWYRLLLAHPLRILVRSSSGSPVRGVAYPVSMRLPACVLCARQHPVVQSSEQMECVPKYIQNSGQQRREIRWNMVQHPLQHMLEQQIIRWPVREVLSQLLLGRGVKQHRVLLEVGDCILVSGVRDIGY